MGRGLRLTLLAILVGPASASGQDIPPGASTRYGLSLGVSVYEVREEVLNSLRHRGPSISLGLFREGTSEAAIHRIQVSFAFAPLGDRYSPDRASLMFHPTVQFHYARKTVQLSPDLLLFVGGTAGWDTRFSFYENWDQAHPYWLTSSHLGLTTSLSRSLGNGGSLLLELDSPLLAVVSRPPERFDYKEVNPSLGWILGEIHGNPRVTSIHEHTAVTATLTYHRPGGGFLGRRFFWQADFVSARLPRSRPFTSLTHTLGISLPL